MTDYVGDVSVEQEIQTLRMQRPHVVLLGAGASKAAGTAATATVGQCLFCGSSPSNWTLLAASRTTSATLR
ncbi:MAG: hypothetical protein ACRDVP_11335 [Acidimicrobiales bacterium]